MWNVKIFDFKAYLDIVNYYKNDFNIPEWLLVGLAILVMIIVLSLIFLGIYFLIRKYVRIRKTLVDQESLLEEVSTLNSKVATLMKEKEDWEKENEQNRLDWIEKNGDSPDNPFAAEKNPYYGIPQLVER